MVNYFIYAKDCSASTDKIDYYHSNGLETLEQFKRDVETMKMELMNAGEHSTESKIIYLHWGTRCIEVDEEITRTEYLSRSGNLGGTYPDEIVEWIKKHCDICDKNNKIKLLYIITDGVIFDFNVKRCFQANENMYYETVVFHAFSNQPNSVDISVASSFLKGRCVVYCNNKLYDNINISEEFDYDKINLDNFDAEKENLKSYIKLKYINKFQQDARALKELEKLRKLRTRLFDDLSATTRNKWNSNLETKDRSVFLCEFVLTDWYKYLIGETHSAKVDVEKSIATLINYIVSETKSYSFDALKFDTKFKRDVVEEPIVNVNFTVEQEIAFPDIILDDDKGIPVIIITELDLLDKIIFHGRKDCEEVPPASFSKFKSTMECPLFLVNDKDISESIGYFYTLNVYKQFMANNTRNEPRTRKPFHGGLVLTDTDEFDKYNDYILLATYFKSKKVNINIGLFYYVLWKNCENKEWMDKNVVARFKIYAMRRISETVCKIGLSSLSLDPDIKTSLLTALWYCVELSSCIFKDDPQNFTFERLRMFHGVAHCMIEILKYFDYDLDLRSIERRRELLSYVSILKKIQKRTDKAYYLMEKIFKNVSGFLVSDIEKPFNLYKLNYLKLDHKNILRDDVVEETVHLNDYLYLMHFVGDLETSKAGKSAVEICEKTFRPLFAVDRNKSFYTELVKKTRKVVITDDDDKDKVKVSFEPIDSLELNIILSLYSLFIHCVEDLEKYPTFTEYVDYIAKKKKYFNDLVTVFPINAYFDMKNVYEVYQKVVSKVEIGTFIKVGKTYANRAERIKGEENVKFDSLKEICHFITSEELKVNLKKNEIVD